MPRQPRVHYPGAIFHVIARGNNEQPVFLFDEDKYMYLNRLEFYQQRFFFRVFAYVLMDNHVHMIIQVKDKPLAKIMQGLQQSYTIYYNRKYQCTGHVFQQRYKAFLCQEDDYLLTLIKYIHQNPIRSGITTSPGYLWSSHNYYTGDKKDKLVDTGFVFNMLISKGSHRKKDYLKFMQEPLSDEFKKKLFPLKGKNQSMQSIDPLQQLIVSVANDYGVDPQLVMQKRIGPHARKAKIEVIKALVIKHHWTQTRVAELFGINRSNISKIMNSQ